MNKTELVSAIAERANMTKTDADAAVKAFVDVVTDTLADGDGEVSIPGFLSFKRIPQDQREAPKPTPGQKNRGRAGWPQDPKMRGRKRGLLRGACRMRQDGQPQDRRIDDTGRAHRDMVVRRLRSERDTEAHETGEQPAPGDGTHALPKPDPQQDGQRETAEDQLEQGQDEGGFG